MRYGIATQRELCAEARRKPGPVSYRHLAGYPVPEDGWPLGGTPADQAEQVLEPRGAGVDELVLDSTILSCAHEELTTLLEQFEAFARDVMPRVAQATR